MALWCATASRATSSCTSRPCAAAALQTCSRARMSWSASPRGRRGWWSPRSRPTSAAPLTDDYEYRGMLAQAWDLLRGDYSNWPDRPFYRAIIERQGGPALDVGCGAGRLILDYLAAGLDVDGVDNSPEMLALCREKAAALDIDLEGRIFLQEMHRLDLPRKYATIFVPSLSFQLVLEPADAAQTMTRFYEHLLPGGA